MLAGDCNSCLGTVAGCGTDALGVVWLDAHADFDTPTDSGSGSLDAMGLALLTGRGWDSLRATVPGLEGVANRYSAPGGLSTVELLRAIALVADRFEIAAAAITAYEPDGDTDGRMARAAGRVLAALMALSAP